jgi:cAMP-dependent protein kinase regulator
MAGGSEWLMSAERIAFENFCPMVRPGRVIPRGARIIYETTDGRNQIVLPIEMADVLLLATGRLTMRQIIARIYSRRSQLHFRTIFTTIHQLRDHGFLENGDELESQSWWQSKPSVFTRFQWTYQIWGSGTLHQARPNQFFIVGLTVLALFGLSLLYFPWPLVSEEIIWMLSSSAAGPLMVFLAISVFLSAQACLKLVFQWLLTGSVFGVRLRVAPWGIYFSTTDEPVFLISNKLFLCLYNLDIVITPLAVAASTAWWAPEWLAIWCLVATLKIWHDISPFASGELMRTIGALLSLDHGDLPADYLKENSLFALLDPSRKPSRNLRLKRWFRVYMVAWTAVAILIGVLACRAASQAYESGAIWAIVVWMAAAVWILQLTIGLLAQFRLSMQSTLTRLRLLLKPSPLSKSKGWESAVLHETISNLPLFSYFSAPTLDKILKTSQIAIVRSGSRLITQGEIGKDLFVLLEGSLLVERSSFDKGRNRLSVLHPVTIFGEMAIVEESERTADVIARERSTVLQIPSLALRHIANESQSIREIEAFRNAIIVNQFFSSAPIFRDLPSDIMEDIAMRSAIRTVRGNEVILRQGDPGRHFFLILRGSVTIEIDGKEIKPIGQGGFFGEISLIADIACTATVRAKEETMLLEVAAANFWEILCQSVELAMLIEAIGEARLREDLQVAKTDSALAG